MWVIYVERSLTGKTHESPSRVYGERKKKGKWEREIGERREKKEGKSGLWGVGRRAKIAVSLPPKQADEI